MLRRRSPFARLGLALAALIRFGKFTTRPLQIAEITWRDTFEGKFEDKHNTIEVFNRHNEEVKQRVPPERLLVYEVKEGWEPLCEFLGVEEPANPFPRLHDAAETRRVIRAVRVFSVVMPTTLALLVGIAALMLLRRGSLSS
jgi:hypothetical protein